MDGKITILFALLDSGRVWSPLIFVGFHIVRQFMFIPVVIVCIAGGVLFGAIFGTILSIIGLWLCCLFFYALIDRMPQLRTKLSRIQTKMFGTRRLNTSQISILRLIPFVHFHLLNLCLLESNPTFGKFASSSFWSVIPLAFFYTVFGNYIGKFSPTMVIVILIALCCLLYLVREKQETIKWTMFFHKL